MAETLEFPVRPLRKKAERMVTRQYVLVRRRALELRTQTENLTH